MPRVALCLVLSLSLSACRKPKGPDANYDKALRLYQTMYASQLEDAYGDPQMEEVVALLRLVDRNSSDKPDADRLLGTIERGQAELARARAERQQALAQTASEALRSPGIDPSKFLGLDDAGLPPDPYGEGASIAAINTESGGCLTAFEPFTERGSGKAGLIYRLSSPLCNAKLPGFVGQALLVVDGRIYRRLPESEIPKPAPPPAPDAGAPAQRRPPPPPPAAAAEQGGQMAPGSTAPPGESPPGAAPAESAPPPESMPPDAG